MKVGDLVKIKQHYHLQLPQDPVGLVLSSYVHKKNGLTVYDVQLFGATCRYPQRRIDQFTFYDKDLELFKKDE
jgi:hypothetical protein